MSEVDTGTSSWTTKVLTQQHSTHHTGDRDSQANRGGSGAIGPKFCGALCNYVTQRFPAGVWGRYKPQRVRGRRIINLRFLWNTCCSTHSIQKLYSRPNMGHTAYTNLLSSRYYKHYDYNFYAAVNSILCSIISVTYSYIKLAGLPGFARDSCSIIMSICAFHFYIIYFSFFLCRSWHSSNF